MRNILLLIAGLGLASQAMADMTNDEATLEALTLMQVIPAEPVSVDPEPYRGDDVTLYKQHLNEEAAKTLIDKERNK